MIQLNPTMLFLILNNRLHSSRILWVFILYLLKLLLYSVKNDVAALCLLTSSHSEYPDFNLEFLGVQRYSQKNEPQYHELL
jgi:hypothetical protein